MKCVGETEICKKVKVTPGGAEARQKGGSKSRKHRVSKQKGESRKVS